VIPAGPVEPCSPLAPGEPIGPISPVNPGSPCGPVDPALPVDPCGPIGPIDPVDPGAPVPPATDMLEICHQLTYLEYTSNLIVSQYVVKQRVRMLARKISDLFQTLL